MPIDIDYDEALGNRPAPECWASIDKGEDFYRATAKALPYEPSPDGNAERSVVALVWLERCVRKCRTSDPCGWPRMPYLSTCVHLDFIRTVIESMVEDGLLEPTKDDPDDSDIHIFGSPTEFTRACV